MTKIKSAKEAFEGVFQMYKRRHDLKAAKKLIEGLRNSHPDLSEKFEKDLDKWTVPKIISEIDGKIEAFKENNKLYKKTISFIEAQKIPKELIDKKLEEIREIWNNRK